VRGGREREEGLADGASVEHRDHRAVSSAAKQIQGIFDGKTTCRLQRKVPNSTYTKNSYWTTGITLSLIAASVQTRPESIFGRLSMKTT
jgi:hypothetical protein